MPKTYFSRNYLIELLGEEIDTCEFGLRILFFCVCVYTIKPSVYYIMLM